MLRQHLKLIILSIIIFTLAACCGHGGFPFGKWPSLVARLTLEGFDPQSVLYEIRTAEGDINTHYDTTSVTIFEINETKYVSFEDPNRDGEVNNFIFYVDTPDVTYTITNLEIKNKKLCKRKIKEFTFLFDGEKKTNSEECIIYK